MASYFTLEIDTAGPDITVIVPQFVVSSGDLDIVIQSNEELEPSFQDFYLIDSKGGRHPFILTYSDKQFKGKVSLFNIPTGILEVHVQVKDTVLNPSPLIVKDCFVGKGARIKLDTGVVTRSMNLNIQTRPISAVVKSRPIEAVIK